MNLKAELDKYKNFIDEFGNNNVFCALSMSLYMDEPLTREFISNYITDDHNDKKVDFLAIVPDEDNLKRIYLVQSTFSEKENRDSAKANKASDLNTAISWLFSGKKELLPNKLKPLMEECIEYLKKGEVSEFHVIYNHNLPESIAVTNELNTIQKDLQDRLSAYTTKVFTKELGKTSLLKLLEKKNSGIKIFDVIQFPFDFFAKQSGDSWEAELSVVDGVWLNNLFKTYGEDLFSANYRGFLGANARKKINNVIKSSAENSPKDFWAYNNGITILTNLINKEQKTLTGISIINGAQTTGCIGTLEKTDKLSDIKVLCKIISCYDSEKSSNIIRYTNTQNAITTWDKYSNDSDQKEIQKQLDVFGVSYSLKRGADNNLSDISIETIAQPLLAFRGNFSGAYDGKNNIFNKKDLYNEAFYLAKGRHLVLVNAVSQCFDTYKVNIKRNLSETATEKQQELYNLISEIGFKSFYMYIFGELIEDIYGQQCDRTSIAIDNNTIKTMSLVDIAAKFYDTTEKLVKAISLAFYRNNNSLRFREVIRDKATYDKWVKDVKDFFCLSIDDKKDFVDIRNMLSAS